MQDLTQALEWEAAYHFSTMVVAAAITLSGVSSAVTTPSRYPRNSEWQPFDHDRARSTSRRDVCAGNEAHRDSALHKIGPRNTGIKSPPRAGVIRHRIALWVALPIGTRFH